MSESRCEALLAAVTDALGDAIEAHETAYGELSIEVRPARLVEACSALKETPGLAFTQLSDLAAVDYLTYGEADWQTRAASSAGFSRGVSPGAVASGAASRRRYGLAYQLLSITRNDRLRVRVFADGEPPTVPSVVEVWAGANWFEREAFDLFGILFDGHPDLRRILTDYGFIGHPFRKDFPLEGHVEVRYDPEKGRVAYEPVSIEPRTLVPRVIREEDWLHSSKPVEGKPDA